MRTIKFRGQCTNDSRYAGEWVTGGLVVCEKGDVLIISAITDTVMCKYHVKPETVGQFTGMLDSNLREIYEGDVVNARDFDGSLFTSVIEFEDGVFLFHYGDNKIPLNTLYKFFIEVIGKIHVSK